MENNGVVAQSGSVIPQVDFDNSADNTIKITEAKARNIYNKFIKAPKLGTVGWLLGMSGTWFIAAVGGKHEDFWGIEGSGAGLYLILCAGAIFFAVAAGVVFIYWLFVGRDKNADGFIDALKNITKKE